MFLPKWIWVLFEKIRTQSRFLNNTEVVEFQNIFGIKYEFTIKLLIWTTIVDEFIHQNNDVEN